MKDVIDLIRNDPVGCPELMPLFDVAAITVDCRFIIGWRQILRLYIFRPVGTSIGMVIIRPINVEITVRIVFHGNRLVAPV